MLSPEHIYAIGPGDLVPDDRRFAVMWMSETALEDIFNLDGAFNSVAIKLQRGAIQSQVIEQLDALLKRYGGNGAFGREDQLSHAFLDAELTQLRRTGSNHSTDIPVRVGIPHQHDTDTPRRP